MAKKNKKKDRQRISTSTTGRTEKRLTDSKEGIKESELNSKSAFLIWLIASGVLLSFWYFLPHDYFYSGDSVVKLTQIENLTSNSYTVR